MREIKFRAWHKEHKKMLTVYVIHQGTYSEGFVKNCQGYAPPNDQYYFKFDQAEWMQYTGLKDKNGKEIYEGDIIMYHFKTKSTNDEFISKVFWDEYMWLTDEHSINRINDIEIIGNIYENIELLNKTT